MSENRTPESGALEQRIQSLREACSTEAQRCESKRKTSLLAGVTLVVVCIFCLARVTNLFFEIDAEALTQIGRIEVEKHLPESREAIQTHLNDGAPEFVARLIKSTLALLTKARVHFVKDLDQRFADTTKTYEDEIQAHLLNAVRSTRADLDRTFAGKSEEEKLEALIAHICGEFETVIGVGIDELYPAYANEINRVNDYLTSLSNTESDKLTQKERQHKELVQTFLRLVIRERANKG